ncbi:hypothetical protein PHMEG_00013330 [Phytophthora megakarya]|uniref:Uncharacterized protein n=1 Tax=Phytophthora megakarya TaxID=4795 RepID=A0A225W875_9STRA|nr:hypothetical protein PHMEG_00013330 [Phytophthora megakarya]
MNPGGRYDNADLTSYTKVLINSPSIKLSKLQSKGFYKAWKSEVPLHFEQRMLGDITHGVERYNVAEGLRRMQFKKWYEMRKHKAFSALALSLSVDLRTKFRIDVNTWMPPLCFGRALRNTLRLEMVLILIIYFKT